jgi:hypothetical protein
VRNSEHVVGTVVVGSGKNGAVKWFEVPVGASLRVLLPALED